jgi:hypothetical protein
VGNKCQALLAEKNQRTVFLSVPVTVPVPEFAAQSGTGTGTGLIAGAFQPPVGPAEKENALRGLAFDFATKA